MASVYACAVMEEPGHHQLFWFFSCFIFSFCFWWLETCDCSPPPSFSVFYFLFNVSKRNSNKSKTSVLCFCQSGELHWTLSVYRCSSLTVFFYLFSFPASCLDRYGLIHQARISASVNAMRVLNTGTEVEAAVADALVSQRRIISQSVCLQEGYNQRG